MSAGDLLAPEFAQKVNDLLRDHSPLTDGLPDAQVVARALHKKGITLIDATRSTFLVDARVHEGVLFRLARHRRQNPPRVIISPEVWKGLPA